MAHEHEGHDLHDPGHGGPGHSHPHEHPSLRGLFRDREPAWRRHYDERAFTVGIGGPVGSGKTALVLALCCALRDQLRLGVVTNDIFTREDAEFLHRHHALAPERIRAVETGGCPHAAIREDISHNLDALEQLTIDVRAELLFVESGGDNLAAQFSRELVDYTIYVIDVAGGDKIPRKGAWDHAVRPSGDQQDGSRAARRGEPRGHGSRRPRDARRRPVRLRAGHEWGGPSRHPRRDPGRASRRPGGALRSPKIVRPCPRRAPSRHLASSGTWTRWRATGRSGRQPRRCTSCRPRSTGGSSISRRSSALRSSSGCRAAFDRRRRGTCFSPTCGARCTSSSKSALRSKACAASCEGACASPLPSR